MKVSIDDSLCDGSEAKVSVFDHGLLYGDGLFEGMRVFGRRLFCFDQHLARLGTGTKAIGLELPGGLERVRRSVLTTVRAYGQDDAYVRLLVTRGDGPLGVDPTTCAEPRVICIVGPIALFSEERLGRGIELVTVSQRRPPADVLDPRIKTLNYMNNALAKLEARRRGADEALLLNLGGNVAEASVANVFVFRGGELLTPPGTDGALEGITRAAVMRLAPTVGIAARIATLGRYDLLGADEVFLTGSGAGLVPVRSLDGRLVGSGEPGPVWRALRSAYLEATRSEGSPID
jgi:branched-chain amino acid aminotransferase